MDINNNRLSSNASSSSSSSSRNSSSSSANTRSNSLSCMTSSREDMSTRTNVSNFSDRTAINLDIIEVQNHTENQRITNSLMIAPLGNLSFLSLDNMTYTNSQGNSPTQVNAMPTPVIHESISMSIFNSDSSVSLNNQNATRMPPTSQNNALSSDQESETENFHKRKINDITPTPHNSESDEPDVKPAAKKMRKN